MTLRDLKYQLQDCRNLELEMLARGWFAEAAHFHRRAIEVARNSRQIKAIANN